MLAQPRLRFLLADEPGTGKTIMTRMYLVEGRRRGLIPGPVILVVPARLMQKWQEELEDFFGIGASRLTPEVARDPKTSTPLSPRLLAASTPSRAAPLVAATVLSLRV
jgi:SNF2 family DNA or RNA helicase